MYPVQIKISDKNLSVKWNDNIESKISLLKMRKLCPCATCLAEKEKQGKSYIPIYSGNQISAAKVQQVGSYAISVIWKDGHNTGIYEYSFLRSLAER